MATTKKVQRKVQKIFTLKGSPWGVVVDGKLTGTFKTRAAAVASTKKPDPKTRDADLRARLGTVQVPLRLSPPDALVLVDARWIAMSGDWWVLDVEGRWFWLSGAAGSTEGWQLSGRAP